MIIAAVLTVIMVEISLIISYVTSISSDQSALILQIFDVSFFMFLISQILFSKLRLKMRILTCVLVCVLIIPVLCSIFFSLYESFWGLFVDAIPPFDNQIRNFVQDFMLLLLTPQFWFVVNLPTIGLFSAEYLVFEKLRTRRAKQIGDQTKT
jgi:hypothetical protein